MEFKLGDSVILASDLASPIISHEGTITKLSKQKDIAWIDGHHRPEDCIYSAYLWPMEYKEELIAVLTERAFLKKKYEDSMALIYQLSNKITNARKG
jgi:hypothetical protein